MGRLFWKFFLFVWLAQMVGVVATGTLFWLEHQHRDARPDAPHRERMPPPHLPPPNDFRPPPPPEHRGPIIPYIHIAAGLFASLLCAAGLAWYIAKPIRHLREAFEAAAEGNLDLRIGQSMGRRRDELADLGQGFDRMSDHVRALMEGQKRLLHDVSHELRSPIARLHAAIGLARQQPARIDDSLLRIEREGERMNRLVGELLTLSRLEAGVGTHIDTLDLADLLGDLIEDTRFEATARHIAVDCPTLPDFTLRANAELLHRAIENVLRNGLRFSPEGGTLRIETRILENRHCLIAITDQGPGVPDDQLEAIFTPFFRGTNPGEGYGLGLAIARRVLAAVNGQITAQNTPTGGLRVEITIPPGL